jgi:thiamine pyrophosphate-dependent acetolactate synthase large subunit-like protein
MNRLEATKRLAKMLTDEIVVANLGNASRDLWVAENRPQNYYSQGTMGMPSSIGLGLALAQPDRKVVVLDGDGSLLMNLGSLATISAVAPKNLIHVVWDNEQFQLTGGQQTHTGLGVNLAAMARGAGIPKVAEPVDEEEFQAILSQSLWSDGPWFILAKVAPNPTSARIPTDPVLLKHNFMRGIGTLEKV